jgi:hypothetical protein
VRLRDTPQLHTCASYLRSFRLIAPFSAVKFRREQARIF